MLQAAKSSSTRQFRRWAPVLDCYATVCVMFYVFDVLFLFQCFYAVEQQLWIRIYQTRS